MKTIKQFLILTLVSSIFVNCNSGSSSDLTTTLSGHTFTMAGIEDVMDDVSASCGDSSETTSTDTGSLFTSAASSSSSSSDYEVSFGSSTYSVTSDGTEVMEGTWEATDGNTLQIESDGETILIDVDVDEDSDTITVSLNSSQDLDCGSSTSSDSSTGTVSASETSSELTSFSGAWCFDTGTPYYLAIVINGSESSAEVAYSVDNTDFLNDASDDLVFSTRSFSASTTTELGQLQTFSTSNVSEIEAIADVEFSNDHTQIIIDFGSFTSYYDLSNTDGTTDGACPDLTVSQTEEDRLDDI